jgi:hypothetical protein
MNTPRLRSRSHSPPTRRFPIQLRGLALIAAAAVAFTGCGEVDDAEIETWEQKGIGLNGIGLNGIGLNGFSDWFNNADGGDIAMHSSTMKYLMGCALSPGRTATFVDKNNVTHSWPGLFGLADSWDLNPITEEQKTWVSGCLMAHANSALPAPKQIQISLRGAAAGLAVSPVEKQVVSTFDGVYFGDLFQVPNKRYLCRPNFVPPANYWSTLLADWGRQCAFSTDGCGGLFTMVDCAATCTQAPAGGQYAWGPTCTVEGKTYNAVSAYVPQFKKASLWTLKSVTASTSCTGCLDGRALTGFTTANYAEVGGWTGIDAGNVWLDIRYNSATTTTKLRVQVNGAAVMNGASQDWSFPSTGNSSTWKVVSIPAVLPPNAKVKLLGATSTSAGAPKVDVVSLRVR